MAQPYDPEALRGFAQQLDQLAERLSFDGATPEQARQLATLGQQLGGAASALRLLAVQQLLAETPATLASLREATVHAEAALARIAGVARVITLVGDVLTLAQAVATQNWLAVKPALAELQAGLAGN